MPTLQHLVKRFRAGQTPVCLGVLFFCATINLYSQTQPQSHSDVINTLRNRAENAFGLRQEKTADSLIDKMIFMAEQSMDARLLKEAFFENPVFLSEAYFSLQDAERKKYYVERALEYARRVNRPDLIALAYIQLSVFHMLNGDLDKADYYANISNTNAMSSANDTAIVMSFLQQGKVNQTMSKVLIALQKYHNALDLTQEKKLSYLESRVHQVMATFYKKLDKSSLGRELMFRSIALSNRTGNRRMLIDDYMVLAQMCLNNDFDCQRSALRNAIHLADSLGIKSAEMEARRLLFYTYFEDASSDSIITMLNNDYELKKYLTNVSPGTLDWTFGQIYLYGNPNNSDSALLYMKKAKDSVFMNSVMIRKKKFLTELAMAYKKKDVPMTIETYKSLLVLQQQTGNYSGMQAASKQLKNLYDQQAEYEQAYYYNKLYDQYTVAINDQSKEDDLALMMIDNERKEKQRVEDEKLLVQKQYFNRQYTLIAIIIFSLFIGLAMMGLYKVSQRTVRALGFFSFLLLFEYITLISKKWVSKYTEGTPWQDFLFMIILAIIMLPLHHWLEHQIIGYLSSKKLIKPHRTDLIKIPEPAVTEPKEQKQETPVRNITASKEGV